MTLEDKEPSVGNSGQEMISVTMTSSIVSSEKRTFVKLLVISSLVMDMVTYPNS